jgi:hypothetical protein
MLIKIGKRVPALTSGQAGQDLEAHIQTQPPERVPRCQRGTSCPVQGADHDVPEDHSHSCATPFRSPQLQSVHQSSVLIAVVNSVPQCVAAIIHIHS